LWQRGIDIIQKYPVSGLGAGTFFRLSPFFNPESDKQFQSYHENAHNYFLQFGSELGIPALFLLCVLIAMPLYAGGKYFLNQDKNISSLVSGCYIGFSLYLLTMMTGHPLILSEQQYLFWFFYTALLVLIEPFKKYHFNPEKVRMFFPIAFFFAISIVVVFHVKNRIQAEIKNFDYNYGFVHRENFNSIPMRWTMAHAAERVDAVSNVFGLKIFAPCANCPNEPQTVSLHLNKNLLDTFHFASAGSRVAYYYLPELQHRYYDFEVTVNQTVNLYESGIRAEKKYDFPLGVAVSEIEFLQIMPRVGIGFSPLQEWPLEKLPTHMEGSATVYRVRNRATLNVQNGFRFGGRLYFFFDPDGKNSHSIDLQLLADGKPLQKYSLPPSKWQALELEDNQLSEVKGLTIVIENNSDHEKPNRNKSKNEVEMVVIIEADTPENTETSISDFHSAIDPGCSSGQQS
jgi:hypothetical protein